MTSAATASQVRRDGDALIFSGALLRGGVTALWKQIGAPAGVRRLDLRAVDRLDSAGLALLAELAARAGAEVTIDGDPAGLAELRAAYRLTPNLAFAAA
ncbi:STAS domain-containing protein [Luteimonas panaciterrae]|uniref:STAS domain-containing protein n=1 Tax=Luteimonas panaciterrae TaxID=363885 RepID=UPI001CFAA265|nr:STAS domain-containing protein [Luteimonas panaciterrae]